MGVTVHRRAVAWALAGCVAVATALTTVTAMDTASAQPRPAAPGMPGDPYDPAPHEDTEAPADAGLPLGDVPTPTPVPLLDPTAVIARGRGVSVTAGELYDRLRDAPPTLQRTYAMDPAALQGLADRLLGDRLLAAEAVRRGLDRDPTVRAALERALVARLRATVINPQAGDGTGVTDDDVRAWYDAHPERFHIPERRRVRVVFVTARREALAVLRLALMQRQGHAVHDFRALVMEHTTDPVLRASAGELPEVTPVTTEVDRALRDAVFEIPRDGEVLSRVVAGRWAGTEGFFVVRRVSHRAGIERGFTESAEWIRQRIVLERRVQTERAFSDTLAREASVTRVAMDHVVRWNPAPVTPMDAGAPMDAPVP